MKLQPPNARDRQATLSLWLREATQLHLANRLAEADTYYKAILKAQPTHIDAKHLLGLLRFQQGRHDEALKLLRQVVTASPGLVSAHANLGNVYVKLGRRQEALASYGAAIALKPDHVEALNNRGVVLLDLGRATDALADFEAAHAIKPDFADAILNRGHAMKDLQRHPEALAAYTTALVLNPEVFSAHNNSGLILLALRRPAEALACFEHALTLVPDDPQALNNRGVALSELNRAQDALETYDRLLALQPTFADAINNRGVALRDLNRAGEALAAFDHAIALRPAYLEAHKNRGLALRDLGRHEDELAAYDAALRLQPDYADAYTHRGVALNQLGRPSEALASLDRSLALKPDDVEASFNRSLVSLLCGDLAGGWTGYALRFAQKHPLQHRPLADCPQWAGEPLAGRRIVVTEEQGLGDIIQFSRYVALLVEAGADVTFQVRPGMHRLMAPLVAKGVTLTERATGPFDVQCPLMSLPAAFGTTLETIPPAMPTLAIEPDLIAVWSDRLGPIGVKIGIVWQGNPLASIDRGRSVPLAEFAPLARVPDIRLISLQKTHGLDQVEHLPDGMRIETLGPTVDAGDDLFVDTAAIMASLDLVITSDTAVAHLAGSLGRPTWLALRHVPDWRWFRDRADSPWYPSMRLYRQPRSGDWASVFAQMASDLGA